MKATQKILSRILILVMLLSPVLVQAQYAQTHKLVYPTIKCINAQFPLHFSEIHFDDAAKNMPDVAVEKVKAILSAFYIEMGGDRNEKWTKVKDSYYHTVRVPLYNYQLYIVILKTPAPTMVNCKMFLYDPEHKTVSAKVIDYNVWAMYNIDGSRMVRSDLSQKMRPKPADMVAEGSEAYPILHVTRLAHNGTFTETVDVSYLAKEGELDTFSFRHKAWK